MTYTQREPATTVAFAPCFDVVTVRGYTDRSGEERAAYTRIGAAWKRERGGYKLRLDALPLHETLFLFERRESHPDGNKN